MRKTTFVTGLIAGTLTIILAVSIIISFMNESYAKESPQRLILLVCVILACLLLMCIYKARHSSNATPGVWTLILSVLCGFLPVGLAITALFSNYKSISGEIIIMVFGTPCTLITIACGIMALVSRKNPPVYTDGDTGSVVRSGISTMNITAVVMACVGGLVNAVFSVMGFITLTDVFYTYSNLLGIVSQLFVIFVTLLALIGAVVLLFNRLQGGILLIVSGGLTLILTGFSIPYAEGTSAAILLVVQLIVLAAGILGIIGFKEMSKSRNILAENAV